MDVLVTDPALKRTMLRQRRACGGDRWDEVWNGVSILSPLPDNDHQRLVTLLVFVVKSAFGLDGPIRVYPGVNVSDRPETWEKNYRVPDIAVCFPGGVAQDRDTHFLGGPDFLVEVLSRGDRARKKLGFYAGIGVREVLLVDRHPWALELYRIADGELELVGKSTADDPQALASEVLPLAFRLVAGEPTRVEVEHRQDGRR